MTAIGDYKAHPVFRSLLSCQWGTRIRTVTDPYPCTELAARTMVIHAPAGVAPTQMEFRFCHRHFEYALTETDRHGGTTGCDDPECSCKTTGQ